MPKKALKLAFREIRPCQKTRLLTTKPTQLMILNSEQKISRLDQTLRLFKKIF